VNRKQFLMVIIAAVGATLVNDAMAVENAVSRLILSTLTPMTVMTGNITQLVSARPRSVHQQRPLVLYLVVSLVCTENLIRR
jgi:hypothetical protein